jgi:hypothetical protein
VCLVLVSTKSNAQTDTLQKVHSAKKASIYSAILPGLGQAYNHKYWKIPIVYGALGTTVYIATKNHIDFKYYNKRLIAKDKYIQELVNNPNAVDPYPDQTYGFLQYENNQNHRNRDFFIVVSALVYGLNILDANVDGHLFSYDISDKLSFKPSILNSNILGQKNYTLSLSFKF